MRTEHIEPVAKDLFEARFLQNAKSEGAELKIEQKLAGKVAKLEKSKRLFGDLRQVVEQATNLWSQRASLRKSDWLYLAAALLYFISPIDAVPDLLPAIGYLDDALILSAVVSVVFRSLSSITNQSKECIEGWIDERTEIAFDRFDQSATHGIGNAVTAVVVGLWGMTTAAAISLSVAMTLGHVPSEWLIYIVLSTVIIALCNVTTASFYFRRFKELDGEWQQRVRSLVLSKIKMSHIVALALPIVVLLSLGLGRMLWAR